MEFWRLYNSRRSRIRNCLPFPDRNDRSGFLNFSLEVGWRLCKDVKRFCEYNGVAGIHKHEISENAGYAGRLEGQLPLNDQAIDSFSLTSAFGLHDRRTNLAKFP